MTKLFLALFLAFTGHSALADDQPVFAPYVGVLQNKLIDQEQLARLDFIVSRQEGNELRLMAVLKLFFGAFESREYVSYRFDDVRYNLLSGQLVFDRPDQDATLVVTRFADGTLSGQLRSASAGDVGTLTLGHSDAAVSTRPLIQPVWGEYRGFCHGANQRLQIQTSRSSRILVGAGDPFAAYTLTAQLAVDGADVCIGTGSSCVSYTYNSGTYDFHKGELALFGRADQLSCRATATGLSCTNGCDFKRSSNEAATGTRHSVARTRAFWPKAPEPARDEPAAPAPATIQGEYRGYVHHELLGKYQAASLNIVSFQDPQGGGGNQLRLSAVGTLFFGPHGSPESLPYRFVEKSFGLTTPQVVFENAAAGIDAVIQVTSFADGEIKGIWYSQIYGRVGEFSMQKDGLPSLPANAQVFETIRGYYESPEWTLTLQAARTGEVGTFDPFCPLDFKGYMQMPMITANIEIAGGSYDFYTGKMTLLLEGNTLFAGYRTERSRIFLKRPTPGPVRPLQPHEPAVFTLVSPGG